MAPTATCQDLTVQLDANGAATITAAQVDNGSSDNCSIATMTLDNSSFDCTDVGTNTVTLTVTDVNSNVSTCTATITVEDNVAPTAICQDLTVQLDANGAATITAAQVDNGSSDNCSVATTTLSKTDFDCTNVGANTVTLTVTDDNSNVSTCTATITVQDNVNPTAICQNLTVQLDASGAASITAAQVDNGSFDNCSVATTTLSKTDFDCTDVGANTVTLTVTDVNSNVSTCTANITVEDNVAPTATCQDLTVQLDANGAATITAAQVDNGSSDNCSIATMTLDNSSFDCTDVGTNTVTLTVTDVNSNVSTCTATITVEDNVAPTAICQDLTVQLDANGAGSITAAQVDNGSSDNCGIATTTLSKTDFDCTNVGANTVTLTVTDDNSNVSTCTATITVQDNVNPTAICQNLTVQLDASGAASITAAQVDNGSFDNCSVATTTLSKTDFDCTDVGANTVTLTVTDVNSNVSTCTATITVEDNVAPTATCQDLTVQLDANGAATITAAQVDNGSSDNCSIATMTLDNSSFDCTDVGTNTVTLTVTDVNSNVSTCTATITVEDNVAPTAICQDLTVQLDANGAGSITAAQVDNGSSDNCGIATTTLSKTDFDCTNVGANTVTLTVTDDNSNVSTCTATITVQDNVNPTAICQNLTVQLDASGAASITAAQVDNGSFDNCSVATTTLSKTDFDCTDVGANTVTLTVTDVNSNVSTCTATITVEDNVAPTATCQDLTVQLDANGAATITAAQVDNGSSDNCSIATMTLDNSSFDCTDVGANTVTLTVTDVNSNVSTCTATITVEDNIAPIITQAATALTLECSATTMSEIDAWIGINGGATATDNCGGNWSTDATDFSDLCGETGVSTVTFTYTDASLNEASTSATITITDTSPPVFATPLPQNGTFECDQVPTPATVSADDCDGEMFVSFSETTTAGTCPDSYQINRTWSSTDACGNTASHTQTLTIQDTTAPVITAEATDETIECDGADHTADFNTWFNNRGGATATDNCGSVTWSTDYTTMGSICSGDSVQVVFTASDDCGNSSSTTAVWKVADTTPPSIGNQATNGQVECDGAGNSADVIAWLNNNAGATATDVCGNVTWTNDFTTMALTCGGGSAVSVVFTATDDCGNSSNSVATFTLIDTTAPTFNEALPADETVQCDAVPTAPTLTATDLCSTTATVSYSETSTPGSCTNSYTIQRTWTASDACDNEVSHVQTLSVIDTTDPLAVGQDVTVQLDAQGNATRTASAFDNGSSDACGTVTFSSSLSDQTGSISFDCSDLGDQTLTLIVTDECGNQSTTDVTVTVEDNVNPTITAAAQDEVHECDGTDYSTQLTAWLANNGGATATDACGGIVWTYSPDPATLIETCGDASEVVVTFTATDGSGNSTDTQATFSIEDTTGPVIAGDATNVTVECDGLGNTGDLAAWLASNGGAGIAADACGNVSWSNNFTGLGMTCAGSGAVEVTFTATDDCGNETTTTAMFTIEDTTGPAILLTASDLTVECDGAGNGAALQAWLDDKAGARVDDDLCGSTVTWSNDFEGLRELSDDCGATGSATVIFSATDDCNNSTDFTATFTIQDATPPQAIANDFSTVLDGTGNASITVADIDGGSSDVCGEVTMTVAPSSFDCDDIGDHTVTLTVVDDCGLSSTATATVTVGAGDAPTITFNTPTGEPENIVVSNDPGECEADVTWDVPTSADNCSGGTLTSNYNPGDTFAVGSTTTVTYTATDASGTVTTASFTVTVNDTENPAAQTQNLTVQLDANGAATITAAQVDNVSTDNCGIATMTLDNSSFDCTDVGANTVTLTVTDIYGNSDTETATITVQDNVNPTAICQNLTVQLDANGAGSITAAQVDNGSSDNCGIASMSLSQTDFDCTDVGANTVTLTVTDDNSNVSTCTATITVQDIINPTAICQDLTVQLDASGAATITAAQVDNGSFDNCGIATMTLDNSSFDCTDVGANTVTLTVTDDNSNVSTCTATITVQDNVAPTAICQDLTVQLDANGAASITAAQVDNGSYDNCAVATTTLNKTDFDCTDVGTNTVTLTVTDVNSNVSTCTATITVQDNVNPTAICQNLTVQLDANGAGSITAAQVDNGSSDNCGIASMSLSQTDFDCTDVGANTVTLTVTDDNSNVSTCTATITVQDIINPTAICQDLTVQLDASGAATITAAQVDNGSSDNCGIATMTLDNSSFDCTNVGANTVTLTVTDDNSNVSTCTATITVEDNVAPTAICQDLTVQLDANGAATITAAQVDNGSSDNCSVATTTLSKTDFDCTNVGANTVTLTVTDVNSNVSTCTATITVQDNINPTAICQNLTVQLDANGAASITAAQVDNGSFDNCGIATMTLDNSSFDCTDVGANTVTLTVTDDNSNVSTCTATITVEDNVAPTAICQNLTVQLDANGAGSITAAQVDNGSFDNCAVATTTLSQTDFNCTHVGANTVTLTVTDVNSNVSTCTATITVQDNINPTAITQDLNVELDANGNGSITAAEANNGSFDNCTIATMTVGQTDFDCSHLGANTVSFTVTDVNGNVTTSNFTVTVEDKENPIILTQASDETVECDGAGNTAALNSWLANYGGATASDNCAVDSWSDDYDALNFVTVCGMSGYVDVTFTAQDASGNTSSTTARFTIEDTTVPYVVPEGLTITVECDGSGNIAEYEAWHALWESGIAVSDVCSGVTYGLINDALTDDCGATGTSTKTYTMTDGCGNSADTTLSFIIADTTPPAFNESLPQNGTFECDNVPTAAVLTATDICSGEESVTYTQTITPGSCPDSYTITRSWSTTDDCGNNNTHIQTLTIQDVTSPTIDTAASDETVQCDGAGNTAAFTAWLANSAGAAASDNCGNVTWSNNSSGLSDLCGATGAETVIFTATDDCGNTSTTTATFTIEDTTNPSMDVASSDLTVECDGSGNTTELNNWLNSNGSASASDICGGVTWSHDFTALSDLCGATGAATVTFTATDDCGNTTTTTSVFTIEDTTVPSIDVASSDLTVECDGSGNTTELNNWLNNYGGASASDDCSGVTWSNNFIALSDDCGATGMASVTFTATDDCGLTSTTTATFTIEDTTPPSMDVESSDMTVECDGAGNIAQLNSWLNSNGGASASDVCSGVSWSNDFVALSDDCGATGSATVTFTATDDCGLATTTTATFTIEDTTPPAFSATAEDLTVECDGAGNTTQLNDWLNSNANAAASDVCGGVTWTHDFIALSDDCGETGMSTVTFTVTDDCGNSVYTSAQFTIEDTTAPSMDVESADLTVECDGAGNTSALNGWLASNGGAAASDACSGVVWSNDFASLSDDCGATGTATVTFTATDDCGLNTSTTATFTIEDTTDPSIASPAQDLTVECDGAGNPADLSAWLASNGGAGEATDVCSDPVIAAVALSASSLADAGPNGTWPYVVTVTSDADPTSGNEQTFEINVTSLPSGGANYRVVKTVANGDWFQASAQPLYLGMNTITVSAVAFQRSIHVQFSDGDVEFNSLAINGEEQLSSPLPGGVIWSNDFTALSDDCGATGSATVTFTATDACGNTSTTTASFTIEDTASPSMDVESSDLTVECDGNGNQAELNGWLNSNGGASASDVCSGVTWSNDFAALSDLCAATGDVTVTFTATDDCGNNRSTTATFTIVDTTNPVVSGDEVVVIDCSQWPWETLYEPTIDELLAIQDTAGNPIITLIEDCGYPDFPIDYTWMSGGCHYDHQLVYRPMDDCGNVGDTLYQLIQVDDFTDPVFTFVPSDTTFACTDDVSAYLEMATAIDVCDPSVNMTFTDSISTEIAGGYAIYREFRAEDCGYNIAFMTQVITVIDTSAPLLTVTAPADVVINGCLSSADTTEATNGSPVITSSDDCNDVTVTYTVSDDLDFTCSGTLDDASGEGSFIVTRTFTVNAVDAAGNTTTVSVDQTFTITDDVDPTVSLTAPADTTVYLDATCFAAEVVHPVSGDASGFIVDATDLCDTDVAHTITHADDTTYTGTNDGVGSYSIFRTYTVMVVDDCGNSSSATTSHTIAVLDTLNPSMTPEFPNDTIIYADDVNGYFDPSPSNTGAALVNYSDNCSGAG